MTLVKGILIDPFACTVTEVEHDADSIQGIYKLISHETKQVDVFTCSYSEELAPGDAIFVDDEGLRTPCDRFFTFAGGQPLAGKGLILGSDRHGETISAATSADKVEHVTFFLARAGMRLIPTVVPWREGVG